MVQNYRKKTVPKPLMVPEANKQQQRFYSGHTVDKAGFHLETQFKAKGYAQNKLAIKANVQLGSGALRRACRLECSVDHTRTPLSHHNGWFSTHTAFETYCSPYKRRTNLLLLGACCLLKAFHDTYMMNEKNCIFSNFTVVNKGSHSPSVKSSPRISFALCLNENSNIYSVS